MSTDTAMPTAPSQPHIDPTIFTTLQNKLDEEATISDSLKSHRDTLAKQSRLVSSILSRIHNTPTSSLPDSVLQPCLQPLQDQIATIQQLSSTASQYPFYRYNSIWQRDVQNFLTSLQLHEWLSTGHLVTIDEVGAKIGVPVNLKDSDAFHITIEDYLLALTSTIEELARLAPNAVTLGDYSRPMQISRFVKDVHAGFQLLNLKNDALRRRSDALKYSVKKVEDVVYDLSLRGLVPKEGEGGVVNGAEKL
jgi:predicted translin family RNA/ssDNA-binding protein